MDVPEPVCAENQVKIRVRAASICSSDVMYWQTENTRLRPPVTLGHEGSGEIVSVGNGVSNLKIGDRVIATTTQYICNQCDSCLRGEYNNCENRTGLGSSANGFFADYLVATERSVLKFPKQLSFEEAALLEPLSCVVHGMLERIRITPMDQVLIAGPGPIGLFAAQLAQTCGANVILSGTTNSLPRLQLAKDQLGITNIINSSEEKFYNKIMEFTHGNGVDILVDCTGNKESITKNANLLKKCGLALFFGVIHSGNDEIMVSYNNLFVTRELTLIGARSTTPISWGMTLRLLRDNKINLFDMISHKFPLNCWEEGFKLVKSKVGNKVVLIP